MPSFDPDVLAAWTGGAWSGRPSAALLGFSVDSRRLAPGHCFVALRTERRDGHDFLGEALKAGASAALVSRHLPDVAIPQLMVADPLTALQSIAREHRRAFKGKVFGITGSAGKTSTKELLALALGGQAGEVLATEGNLNNHIGVALTLCRLDPARNRFAVIEAGISAPGEMAVLAGMIEPDVTIVTLIAAAHLADLGGLEGVAREKAVLAKPSSRLICSIFPEECLFYAAFREISANKTLVLGPSAGGVRPGRAAYTVSHEGDRTRVVVRLAGGTTDVTVGRTTEGMARNVALAVCAALTFGIPEAEIRRRLAEWHPSPMRGEWKSSDGQRIYLDCYNANPASMADALATFAAVAPAGKPRLLLIGCMEELGAESERYHIELGRSINLRKGDRLVAIGSLASAIRTGALASGNGPDQIETGETVGAFASTISAFRGSVFVKGSRRHQLEKAFMGEELAGVGHA
ncbi:MAG TPA: UDP-N-acetylmuramoyl-tripeptide--D-alanyl-D-alanine ligase [Opitutaceae bacterium]